MKKKYSILVTFVGTNDAGKLIQNKDGAILTVLKHRKFDEVRLLWTSTHRRDINYDSISQYLQKEIIRRKYARKVKRHYIDIKDVTDHNEIYPLLLSFLKTNFTSPNQNITAAIASGTPSMQACWILIAESGDFKMELIRSNEPETGKKPITKVNLGSSLPKIIRLVEENINLKRINVSLLPSVTLNTKRSELKIDNRIINLSPFEFCYYRYFLERAKNEEDYLKISGYYTDKEFCRKIIQYYQESYPDYDINIIDLKTKLSNSENISASNFRSVTTKIKNKIKKLFKNPAIYNYLIIESQGPRYSKSYGISLPKEKITIT